MMVSILIPTYNAEKTIRRCLDSVLTQTYSDIEVIVINDGSVDKTEEILISYAERDKRITVCNQANKGVAVARNIGLKKAMGKYILYVDADDWLEPDMVYRMVGLAVNADIVFCGNDHAETQGQVKHAGKTEIEQWDQDRQMLEFMKHKHMTGMLWNKLIRRSITEGCEFNEQTGYGEDAEFLWQVLKKSKIMAVTNEVLYHHVLEAGSISHISFSDKKYTVIPMWERIVTDVEHNYPELLSLSIERLMSAAVYSGYEMKKAGYKNIEQQKHIQNIVRNHIKSFLQSNNISKKMKFFAVAICGGGIEGRVSVIIPVYNTEKYVKKCLESVICQTYHNIEVILINDGSKDHSREICAEYEQKDGRVWLFDQKNAGVSAARNHGLDLAMGDYILFVDSDDWIEPNMIQELVQNVTASKADISCCQYDRLIRPDISSLEIWSRDDALRAFLIHQKINGSLVNKLIRQELLQDLCLDTSIHYGEDALFLWEVLLNIRSLCITKKVLYHVTLHEDSATGGGSYKPIRRDCMKVWEAIAEDALRVRTEYGDIARAQLASMAFFSLYQMAYYNYQNIADEMLFKEILKANIKDLKRAIFISASEKFFARVMLICFGIARIFIQIRMVIRR